MNPFLLENLKLYDIKRSGNGTYKGSNVNWYELNVKQNTSLPFEHYQTSCEGQKRFLFEINGYTNYLSENLFNCLMHDVVVKEKKCFGK